MGSGGFIPVSIDLLRSTPGVELIKSQLLYTEGVYVHNQYLNMLVELGIIGLGLFVFLLVTAFVLTWRSSNRLGNPPPMDALIPMQLGFAPAIFPPIDPEQQSSMDHDWTSSRAGLSSQS